MLRMLPVCIAAAVVFASTGCDDEADVCGGDYSQIEPSAVSFEHDVMPIFEASCTFSSCHDMSAKKADLVLGDKNPVDPNLSKLVRDGLLAPSKTLPAVPRVTPSDPTRSFLMDKITGTQNDRGYTGCVSQDPSRSDENACGDVMPLGGKALCTIQSEKVIAIAEWIRAGAQQN